MTVRAEALVSQVAELEPLQSQPLTSGAYGEAADALADAHASITDVLDVNPGGHRIGVAGSPDLDGFDRQAAAGGAYGDRRALAAGALTVLPTDGRDVCPEADHLALELSDLDCLEAQPLSLGAGVRRPADALHMRADLEVRPGARIVRLCRSADTDDKAECGQHGYGNCRNPGAPARGARSLYRVVHECFIPVDHLFRRRSGTTVFRRPKQTGKLFQLVSVASTGPLG